MTVITHPDGEMASEVDKEVMERGGGRGGQEGGGVDEATQVGAVLTPETTAPEENEIMMSEAAVDTLDIPDITVQGPTPRTTTVPPAEVKQGEDDEDGDDDDDDDDDGDAEEMEEEEEEEKEMTQEEKREMYLAVQSGDIDALEDCLDKPNSDITMIWYRENLLMTSIREGHQEMAEFLLDNGVDHTFTTNVMGMRDTTTGKIMEQYELSCRQMAYDKHMLDTVELIDLLQGNLFPFYKPAPRTPRYRRPKPVTPPESERSTSRTDKGSDVDRNSCGSQTDSDGSDGDDQGGLSGVSRKSSGQKRRRRSAKTTDDCDGEQNRTGVFSEGFEVDSGHHSLGSSKLKIGLVREHERLSEREEKVESNESVASPKRATTDGDQSVDQHSKGPEEERTGVHDEGYGSLKSSTPRLSPVARPLWMAAEPSNQIRSTKSALAAHSLNRYQNMNRHCDPISENYKELPLKWKKVSSVGSYANESKYWHQRKSEVNSSTNSDTANHRNISLLRERSSAASTTTGGSGVSVLSSSSADSRRSKSATPSAESSTNRPGAPSVARYMQPTKCSITKQRLSPNFAASYKVLGFTHVVHSPSRSADVGSSSRSLTRLSQKLPYVSHEKVLQRRAQHTLSFRR